MATLQQVPPTQHTRLLFNNILVVTDFSEMSRNSLEYAIFLARKYRAKIYAAHVVTPIPSMEPVYDIIERQRKIGETQLAELAGSLKRQNIPCETILEYGDVSSVIQDVTRSKNLDLIVLGTHGARGMERLAMGSTAEEIFRSATCPVLTVGANVRRVTSKNPAQISKILYATDFCGESLRAVPYVVSLAQEFQAFTYLAHVMPKGWTGSPDAKEMEQQLKSELERLVPLPWENWSLPAAILEHGNAVEGILKLAKERGTDLIVLGAKKAPAIASHLHAGVAYQVVKRATCPVLTVT